MAISGCHTMRFPTGRGEVLARMLITGEFNPVGRPEMILGIRLTADESGERFDPDLAMFVRELSSSPGAAASMQPGGWTEFSLGGGSLFGRTDVGGVIYAHVPPSLESFVPTDSVVCVLITESERNALAAFGPARVLARLGSQARAFPCPAWFDRERAEVITSADRTASVLSLAPSIRLRGSTVFMDSGNAGSVPGSSAPEGWDTQGGGMNGMVELVLAAGDAAGLAVALAGVPDLEPFWVLPFLPRSMGRLLTWNPDAASQGAAHVISNPAQPDPRRVHGCFLGLAGEQEESSVRVVEDGFVSMLTTLDYRRVTEALRARQSVRIHGPAGEPLLFIHEDVT